MGYYNGAVGGWYGRRQSCRKTGSALGHLPRTNMVEEGWTNFRVGSPGSGGNGATVQVVGNGGQAQQFMPPRRPQSRRPCRRTACRRAGLQPLGWYDLYEGRCRQG